MGIDAEMMFTLDAPLSEADFKLLNYDMASAFDIVNSYQTDGPLAFWKHGDGDYDQYLHPTEEGKTTYRIALVCRYYGEGYERGPFLKLKALADWIEANIPGATVLYGGDCDSGLSPWPKEEREKLYEYYIKVNNRPYIYRPSFNGTLPQTGCDRCARPLTFNGGGKDKDFLYCPACHKQFIYEVGTLKQVQDYFKGV